MLTNPWIDWLFQCPHHDGVRFGQWCGSDLQLGTGVQGWVFDALSSPLTVRETTEVLKEVADSSD